MSRPTYDGSSMSLALTLAGMCCLLAAPPDDARHAVTTIVAKIQRADYEADRAALRRLHDDLAPFTDAPGIASRVLYWRGFALWRRAFNGFNDKADRNEIDADLIQAAAEFHDAASRDPAFVDAKIAEGSCLVNSAVIHVGTPQGRDLFTRSAQVLAEAAAAAPDNPRLLWVQGANQWYAPPERGGGQDVALSTYARGLEIIRRQRQRQQTSNGGASAATDPLDPSWGEPELLMNLAWSNLNRKDPDIAAAERFAEAALTLVPYWHYVRDVLMVQIKARRPTPP